MLLKLANRLVLPARAVEVSQPFASYGATILLVESQMSLGSYDLFLDGSDDLDNWTQIGSALITQTFVSTQIQPFSAATGHVLSAGYLRLRFVSTNSTSATVVIVFVGTAVV